MIGRHDGRVVFVAGAIPGERVEARVERVQKQLVWAETTRVIAASPDRVPVPPGLACGGQVLAHVSDDRQRALKAEMLVDAFRRVGKIADAEPPAVHGGPADGYRTRARLHLRRGQVGFFEEGTHRLCDVAASRQLATTSAAAVARLAEAVAAAMPNGEAEIEWAEDVDGTTRIAHLTLGDGRDADPAHNAGAGGRHRRRQLLGGRRRSHRGPSAVGRERASSTRCADGTATPSPSPMARGRSSRATATCCRTSSTMSSGGWRDRCSTCIQASGCSRWRLPAPATP